MELLKTCSRCKLTRPVSEFTKNRSKKDGLSCECRSCKAESQARYLNSDKGRKAVQRAVKKYQATGGGKEAFNKATAKYCASEHGKRKRSEYYSLPEVKDMRRDKGRDYYKKRKKEHPEKYRAYCKLKYALESGKIKKPDKCEDCPATKNIQAHHEDYSKPYNVNWLCPKCHRRRDRERRVRLALSSGSASHPGQEDRPGKPSLSEPGDPANLS